jgi:hypothetical protein
MDESLSVENQILLCCARREFDASAVELLLGRGVDWEALLAVAQPHHLLPLLYERLAEVDGGRVPPDVMAHLQGAYYANLLRNRRLGAELAEVIGALRREGVEAIVLKGGALAWTVYASLAQRPMADLDLLVRREQMEQVGVVLESLGFSLPAEMPARRVRFERRFGGGLEWVRSAEGQTTHLDVKHDLLGWDWCRGSFPVESSALWAAASPFDLNGTLMWQLSLEDSLIHLCLHPALHHGYACPLISYVDIDRVIAAAEEAFSWSRLVERARRFQVKTVVYCGLQYAQHLLGTSVPSDLQAALKPGSLQLPILQRLAPLGRDAVSQRPEQRLCGVREFLLYTALLDQFWAVGGMVRGLAFPSEEWLAVRYSLETRSQARLYRPVHLWRVARSFLRGLHRPLGQSSLE